ncbi:MAG: HD domain-containing protein [Acetatifactor sp.]
MIPSREKAEEILREGASCNPGPWEKHSHLVAQCAERIAEACGDLEPEKAYVLGLLHDIGRKFGVSQLKHVYDGYQYMMKLGYDEAAKICLTHSFCEHAIDGYVGKYDITGEQLELMKDILEKTEFDDYDLLIQLCDSLAGGEAIMNIEDRMLDVKRRYGSFPQSKWDRNMELKTYFENRMRCDVYAVVRK